MTAESQPNQPARFVEPVSYGYLYLGFRVDPPKRAPFVRASRERERVLASCKEQARRLEAIDALVAATVYEAVLIPPVAGSPKFDVLVLVETATPEAIAEVESAEAYRALQPEFAMAARNIRRIGDVDRSREGTFLFNHFTAAEPEAALRTFDQIAGWFTDEADVDDSALLGPTGASAYVFVNHVRLPVAPIRFMLNFAKPSFRSRVAARLRAAGIGNAPVICRTR